MGSVYTIPGKLDVDFNSEVRAIVDTWTTYFVTLQEFRVAVLEKGITYAKANQGQAWIVDSSKATGAFSKEIQDFIGTDAFPTFSKAGIKYFLTINSQSALTKMTVANYAAKTGPNNLQLVEASSVEGAIDWLKKHAQ